MKGMSLCLCCHTKWYIHEGLRGDIAGGTDSGDTWGERRQGESTEAVFQERTLISSQSQILRPDMFQKGLSANEGQASEGWVRDPLLHHKMP